MDLIRFDEIAVTPIQVEEVEACNRFPCPCSHTKGCEKGWIWVTFDVPYTYKTPQGEMKEAVKEFEGVKPCPVCDPERARLFKDSFNRIDLMKKLQLRSTSARNAAYDMAQGERTRIL